MHAWGTLGKTWDAWKESGHEACRCNDCGVLHASFGSVMVWGECFACNLESKQIDLYGKEISDDYSKFVMECKHKPVGLTRVWVHMRAKGVILFNVEIECHNPSCEENPSYLVLCNGTPGQQLDRESKAVPCCSKPKLSLVGIRGYFLTEGPLKIPLSAIFYSQDTISRRWREKFRGMVEDSLKRVNEKSLSIDEFPRIQVTYYENRLYSLDNRRLKVFKEHALGAGDPHMLVEVQFVHYESSMTRHFTTTNGGILVQWR